MADLLTTTIDGAVTEKTGTDTSATVTTLYPQHHTSAPYTSDTTIHNTAVYNITSGKVVVAYVDTSDSSYGKAVVGTITGDTIAFGTPVNFSDTTAVNNAGLSMATLPGSSKVVIAWSEGSSSASNVNNKGTSKVGTISGTTISFGAEATFDASTYAPARHNNKCMVSDTTNNRVILAWYGGGATEGARQIYASCGTVSGTTLTWSTAVPWGGGTSVYFQYQSVVYDATADKFVIAWENSTTNAQHVVGTAHSSTNAITFGTPVVDAAYSWDTHAMTYSAAAGKIVHIFRKYGISPTLATGFARVGTISGTTVSWGVESTFPLTSTNDMYDPNIIYHADTQKVMIIYSGSNREIYGVGGTITGTTISLSTRILINDVNLGGGSTSDPGLAYDTVTKKVVLSTNTLSGTKAEILGFDSTNLTVDLATGNFFEVDLETTNNISAITVSNTSSTHVSSFVLKITQGYTPRKIEWSELSAFKWIGGTAPTLTTVNDKIDTLSFTTYDNGTTWYGSVVGQNYPHATIPSNLFGERGLFGGGSYSALIEYITISTLGNATTFGNLTYPREGSGATSDASRGVWAGGRDASNHYNIIDYITIATPGNATDFGDLTAVRTNIQTGTSNGPRGIFPGGENQAGGKLNQIEYITIATPGNATDFGDLTLGRKAIAATSDGVRGVFGGGYTSTKVNTIDYITIATTGNAYDFGDLTVVSDNMGACSDGSRGLWAGGGSLTLIHSVNISTTSNAVGFGNMIGYRRYLGSTSNGSRGVFIGGIAVAGESIEYITISTPSNGTDFGDLSVSRNHGSATSGN